MIYPQNFEQKIGFNQIRDLLKAKCLSTLGEERVDGMAFSDNFGDIERRLEQTTEFVRIIQEEDSFPDQYFFDVRASLRRIRIEGLYLDEQEVFDLRRSLETIRDIVSFLQQTEKDENEDDIQKNGKSPYPALHELVNWQETSWYSHKSFPASTVYSTSSEKSRTTPQPNFSGYAGNWPPLPATSREA